MASSEDVVVYMWDLEEGYLDASLTRLGYLPRIDDHIQLFEAGIVPQNNSPQRDATSEPTYQVVEVLHKVWRGPNPTDPSYRQDDDDGCYHGDLIQLIAKRVYST